VARATAQSTTKTPPRIINLPEGDHDEVMLGELRQMVIAWTPAIHEADRTAVLQHGEAAGRPMDVVVTTLA